MSTEFGGVTTSFTFTQTLIDPCVGATVTGPTDVTEMYTITDDEKVIQLTPVFASNPSFCSLFKDGTTPVSTLSDSLYTLTLTPSENSLTFSPDVITDLAILNGFNEETYTFTVRSFATSLWDSNTEEGDASVTVTVTFKNPCVDTNFVTVSQAASTLGALDYVILTGPEV